MRVGLLGGTFDPVHEGHVRLACAARDLLHLDRVLLAPVARQPLKTDVPGASWQERMQMVTLAIAQELKLEISSIDGPLDGGEPNYTEGTLAALRKTLPDFAQVFLIMGADAFAGFRRWHAPEEVVRLADLCVATRPGFPFPEPPALLDLLPAGARLLGRENIADANALVLLCGGALLRLVEMRDLDVDVSATFVREQLERGVMPGMVRGPVAAFIREHHLYGFGGSETKGGGA